MSATETNRASNVFFASLGLNYVFLVDNGKEH